MYEWSYGFLIVRSPRPALDKCGICLGCASSLTVSALRPTLGFVSCKKRMSTHLPTVYTQGFGFVCEAILCVYVRTYLDAMQTENGTEVKFGQFPRDDLFGPEGWCNSNTPRASCSCE